MLKTYIDTGKIVNTHGIRGDVKMEAWTDDPEMFCVVKTLYLDAQGREPLTVERARVQKGMVLLKLKGVDTMDDAAKFRGRVIYIHRDDIPMEEGQYLIQDLLGCRVVDADSGREYGEPGGCNCHRCKRCVPHQICRRLRSALSRDPTDHYLDECGGAPHQDPSAGRAV